MFGFDERVEVGEAADIDTDLDALVKGGGACNDNCVTAVKGLHSIDDLRLQAIAEHHRELIHDHIPTQPWRRDQRFVKFLTFRKRILMTASSVGKTLRWAMFLRICECRLSMALVV